MREAALSDAQPAQRPRDLHLEDRAAETGPPAPAEQRAASVRAASQRRRSLRRLTMALGALFGLLLIDRAADLAGTRWALGQLHAEADAAAALRVTVIRSEIEKQRTLPVVLSRDPDVRAALEDPSRERLDTLDRKLAMLAEGTRTGVIYLIDEEGMAVAASNAGTPASFVGSSYAFRPYFRLAMDTGAAEHFALGTVSHVPGLYLSRRVDGPEGPLGVLVVKAEFGAIEGEWQRFREPTFVTDLREIVLVSSVPQWRFAATAPLTPEQREAIRASLQFGDAPLKPLPITRLKAEDLVEARLPDTREPARFVEASALIPGVGWTLHVLAPADITLGVASAAARSLALLAGLLGCTAAGIILYRRRLRLREAAQQAEARRELEARVEERTAALSQSNQLLREEMAERRRARVAIDLLKDELAQAGRLAVLGQIAASVAHEVNQPVAAIRTFAETGGLLLARGDTKAAGENLATIASLTERIGVITGELRAFAHKTPGAIGKVAVREAVDGALMLVGHRLSQQAVAVSVELDDPSLAVIAERVRLEQVLINLLQNALDVLAGRDDGAIRIRAAAADGMVRISFADNGPGLPREVMEALFIPFTTTKPQGLGLGLVIAHDIVAEFGGTLSAENRDGAVFTLALPRAE